MNDQFMRNFWTQPKPETSIEEDRKAYEAFKTQLGGNHTMKTLDQKKQEFMELVAVHEMASEIQLMAEEGMRDILSSIAKEAVEETEERIYPSRFYVTKDESLVETITSLHEVAGIFGDGSEVYQNMYTAVRGIVQEQVGTDKVISLSAIEATGEVLVFEYDGTTVEESDSYKVGYDAEKDKPYLTRA